MDWTAILCNMITQLVVLIVGIPTLIIQVKKMSQETAFKQMENTKEKHYKDAVIYMLRNDYIKIEPEKAKTLLINLLAGTIDSETAYKQMTDNLSKGDTNEKTNSESSKSVS